MNTILSIKWIVFILIILILLVAIPAIKIKREEYKKTGKHPRWHYMGIGLIIGLTISFLSWFIIDNSWLWVPVWVALGLAIWAVIEKKFASELRSLTKK